MLLSPKPSVKPPSLFSHVPVATTRKEPNGNTIFSPFAKCFLNRLPLIVIAACASTSVNVELKSFISEISSSFEITPEFTLLKQ